MSLPLPVPQSTVGAQGAATETPITVSGILTGNTLLALVAYTPGSAPEALDTTAFTVSDGAIESATVDTDGARLAVVYYRG